MDVTLANVRVASDEEIKAAIEKTRHPEKEPPIFDVYFAKSKDDYEWACRMNELTGGRTRVIPPATFPWWLKYKVALDDFQWWLRGLMR